MAIYGKGTETYLYLNGIRPRKEARLDDAVVLLASSCNPTLDEIIAKSKREIDIGVACVFLRSVSACLRVIANTPQELAVKTWNAQWDAVLLGALYDCEVGHNFQCDVAPESFSEAKEFHVTNYAFKGLNSGVIRTLTSTEHVWLMAHYGKAQRLLDDDRYRNAVHCLASYRWHSMPRAQLALIWSGIEGLFEIDYELSFRLSLYIAKYLSPRGRTRQKAIFDEIKNLYGSRSKAVHGGKLKGTENAVKRSLKVLRQLIVKSAEQGSLPKCSELWP